MKNYCVYLILHLLIVPSLSHQTCCCDIIQTTFGFVEAGNSTVFKLPYVESFDICLSSERGDADLYISDRNTQPSYDPASYTLHSATCGDDILHIDKKLKRPIYVSVYGHPSAEISIYYMNIVIRESTEVDSHNFDLLDIESEEEPVDVYPVQVENILEDNSNEDTNRSFEELNTNSEEAPAPAGAFNLDTIRGFFNRIRLDESGVAISLVALFLEALPAFVF